MRPASDGVEFLAVRASAHLPARHDASSALRQLQRYQQEKRECGYCVRIPVGGARESVLAIALCHQEEGPALSSISDQGIPRSNAAVPPSSTLVASAWKRSRNRPGGRSQPTRPAVAVFRDAAAPDHSSPLDRQVRACGSVGDARWLGSLYLGRLESKSSHTKLVGRRSSQESNSSPS